LFWLVVVVVVVVVVVAAVAVVGYDRYDTRISEFRGLPRAWLVVSIYPLLVSMFSLVLLVAGGLFWL
jgi:hypothetical protein